MLILWIPPPFLDSCRPEQLFYMRGGSKVDELKEEQNTRDFAFATYVASQNITKGTVINESLLVPKRPSAGDFYTRDLPSLIGKIAQKDIAKDEHILFAILSSSR